MAAHGGTVRRHGPSRLGDPGCRRPHVVRIRRPAPPGRRDHFTPHPLRRRETAAGTERRRRGRRLGSTSTAEDEAPAGLRKDREEPGLDRRRPGRTCRWRRGTEPTPSGAVRRPVAEPVAHQRNIRSGNAPPARQHRPPPTSEHFHAGPPSSTDYSISGGHLRRPTQQVVAPGDPTPPVVAGGRANRPARCAVRIVPCRLIIECSDSRADGAAPGGESAPERRPGRRLASRDRRLAAVSRS